MHFRAITRIVGLLVILFSGTMIIPGLVALIYRDGAGRAFTQTFFVALTIGSLLWWPTTLSVRAFLQRMGLAVAAENSVPDDHISHEIELVVMLSVHARHSPQYQDALARFVCGHLELWLPAFIEKINLNAKTSAIKRLALQLTNWFDELKTRVIL